MKHPSKQARRNEANDFEVKQPNRLEKGQSPGLIIKGYTEREI